MSKKIIYFSAAAGAFCIFAAGMATAHSPYTPHDVEPMQHFHQGKFSSEKGEFKMSQNNVNDDTLWEKTKEMSAKAWEATKDGTAKVWDKTKELGSDAWDKTKELSGNAGETVADKSEDAWEATKDGAAKAGDAISETSADAMEATKDGTAKAWDKTKEVSSDAWEATKKAADDAGDALSGERYDNPMYNPQNGNAEAHYNHHVDN